jgi:prepilin-type N-terminal cleavage/methylation domain-containing protein
MCFYRTDKKSGFTMIELLMVIMLVAVLSAVALPQFLDFRTEGRVAATQSLVSSVRSGIKLQYTQQILRCSGPNGSWPTISSIASNDITFGGGPCTAAMLPNASEHRIVDQETLPRNPFSDLADVADCSGWASQCANAAISNGWCYNVTSGNFWAATNVASECAF